jgi:CP family cyanate transporter-like MFS transporter
MFTPILCLPPIEHIITRELLLTHAQAGLLFSIPIAILAVVAIPSGLLADRIGIRKAAGIGVIIMAVGSLMRGTATTSAALFGFTGLFGVGFALVYPNLPKLIGAWFPREKIGLATGIYTTGIAVGATLPFIVTLPLVLPITNTIQGVFYIWSIPAIVAAILWWVVIREPPYSGIQPQGVGKGGKSSFWVLRNRNLWLVGLLLFANCFHFYIWTGWTPALMMLKGAPPALAALIASVRGWVSPPVIFLVPWASYKIGLRKPFLWASAIVLALASYSAIYVTLPWGWLLMVVVGITLGGAFSMMLALPAELVPKESVGAASGMVLSIGYGLGGLGGPWLAGYLLDVTGTLNSAFVILAGVAMLWAFIAFIMPETGAKARQQK